MPIRHGGILASRASTCPRDHFCRSTIAPRPSRPTTWNVFLPISIPITAVTLISFSAMGVLLSLSASVSLSLIRQEHGRTIPLPEVGGDRLPRGVSIQSTTLHSSGANVIHGGRARPTPSGCYPRRRRGWLLAPHRHG